jgi:hypothetical protein
MRGVTRSSQVHDDSQPRQQMWAGLDTVQAPLVGMNLPSTKLIRFSTLPSHLCGKRQITITLFMYQGYNDDWRFHKRGPLRTNRTCF